MKLVGLQNTVLLLQSVGYGQRRCDTSAGSSQDHCKFSSCPLFPVGWGPESALPCACKHLAGKPRGLQGRGIRVSIKSTGPRTAGSGPRSSPAARAVLSEKFRFRKTGDKGVYFCGLTGRTLAPAGYCCAPCRVNCPGLNRDAISHSTFERGKTKTPILRGEDRDGNSLPHVSLINDGARGSDCDSAVNIPCAALWRP